MADPGLALTESRLRDLIAERDLVARQLARLDDKISRGARAYADAQGVTVKPTIAQLRDQLRDVPMARPDRTLNGLTAGQCPATPDPADPSSGRARPWSK
jgi:hypothetical protein